MNKIQPDFHTRFGVRLQTLFPKEIILECLGLQDSILVVLSDHVASAGSDVVGHALEFFMNKHDITASPRLMMPSLYLVCSLCAWSLRKFQDTQRNIPKISKAIPYVEHKYPV